MKRTLLLIVTILAAVVLGTCQSEESDRIDRDRIDPGTGLMYPTLEPVIWEGVE